MKHRLIAEGVGTALLLAAVVGSGIMAERLSGGNNAVALLANAIATGAALYPLILSFDGLSGAHFNPAVSLVMELIVSYGGGWSDPMPSSKQSARFLAYGSPT